MHTQLQELPDQWSATTKLALTVKQAVAPLQQNEVALVRRKCTSFDVKQHEFREVFRKQVMFRFSSKSPYHNLDEMQKKIKALEDEMAALQESAGLFEVAVPDYKQLKVCLYHINI